MSDKTSRSNFEPIQGGSNQCESTLKLYQQAIVGGWPVPDDAKQMVVDDCIRVIKNADGASSERAIESSKKILIAAVGQNQADLHLAAKLENKQQESGSPSSVVVNNVIGLPKHLQDELNQFRRMAMEN